jgi:hypothetical protein
VNGLSSLLCVFLALFVRDASKITCTSWQLILQGMTFGFDATQLRQNSTKKLAFRHVWYMENVPVRSTWAQF